MYQFSIIIIFIIITSFCSFTCQQPLLDYPTANLSTKWTNSLTLNTVWFPDTSNVRYILSRTSSFGLQYACGFYCSGNVDSCLFAILIVQTHNDAQPQVVWSPNGDSPVRENATVELTAAGELVLRDADEALAWSTDVTTGKAAVAGLNLTETGSLVLFDANASVVWESSYEPVDTFTGYRRCDDPMVCGEYGICSDGQCSCPGGSFRQTNERRPELGCSEVVPLVCNASDKLDHFLDLYNVTYFSFVVDINNTDINGCKEACARNCSCRAAMFRYNADPSGGDCHLPSRISSLINDEDSPSYYRSSVSLKVQITPTDEPLSTFIVKGKGSLLGPVLGSIVGVFCVAVVIGAMGFVYRKRKMRRRRSFEEVEEEYLDEVGGMPTRFSFEEIASATDNFNKKLGEGGSGSVFEGTLRDGTRIAVKRLDGVGHIKKSFLAEVESIGSVHHINLVRLFGFCAEKSHRLLVYEYMCNGSLDKWIYCSRRETTPSLDWKQRRKIILDIAKGLAYLHEDCRQKIIHLDIKPQNILLDELYNAKLADFGLAKLIDKNQSRVVTTMRGTPGYLAPEWLSSVITEKVDVYSFGVVVLEIVSGRKVYEQSRPEEESHLPTLFMKKAEQGKWLDLIDKCCLNVELNIAQVEEVMQIAAWCIQSDHEKRPCMSMVIKVLEGAVDVQKDINYSLIPHYLDRRLIAEVGAEIATPILPSVLSGPR